MAMNRWIGLLVGLSLVLAACGGPNVASTATVSTTSPTAIRWSETAAPPGVDVPGAQWLKIEGAGGNSKNVQVAAVLRPQGSGAFPLVVWLHGSSGGVRARGLRRVASGLCRLRGSGRLLDIHASRGVRHPRRRSP